MLLHYQMGIENVFDILIMDTSRIQLVWGIICRIHRTPNLGPELVDSAMGTGMPKWFLLCEIQLLQDVGLDFSLLKQSYDCNCNEQGDILS